MQNAKQNPTQQKEQPWREDIKTKNQQKRQNKTKNKYKYRKDTLMKTVQN